MILNQDFYFGKTVGFRRSEVHSFQVFEYQGKPRLRINVRKPSGMGLSLMGAGETTETLMVTAPSEVLDALAFIRGDGPITEEQLLKELGGEAA